LTCYCKEYDGFITHEELECFFNDSIPSLGIAVRPNPYYNVTALRKFIFFHDKTRQGKYSLDALVQSPVLLELTELKENNSADDLSANWFSLESTSRVYSISIFIKQLL
jgi:hypothetical protein